MKRQRGLMMEDELWSRVLAEAEHRGVSAGEVVRASLHQTLPAPVAVGPEPNGRRIVQPKPQVAPEPPATPQRAEGPQWTHKCPRCPDSFATSPARCHNCRSVRVPV